MTRRFTLARTLALSALLVSCGAPTPVALNDAGPRPLICTTPQRLPLVAPTTGTNAGIPMAGIAWGGDHCELTNDEHAAGMVLLVADFTGTIFVHLSANAGSHWNIDSSSSGGSGAYIVDFPRDTDITVTMSDPTESVSITFRLEGSTLVLLDMHRV